MSSYAGDNMAMLGNTTLPPDARPVRVFKNDSLFNSVGLYSKQDIEDLKFRKYSRFGKPLDFYGKMNECREYLFFVKPDLHLAIPDASSSTLDRDVYKINGFNRVGSTRFRELTMNPQLNTFPYFRYLFETHENVVKELQYSASKIGDKDPFSHLLSFACTSNLDLPGQDAQMMDTPMTPFGTSYKYLRDSEASEEAITFDLEFLDDKDLNVYNFFKAYAEYHIARKSGLITPPDSSYYKYKRLHNTMGIYKFLVAEDSETIIYWAYFWGVTPTSAPRGAFSNPSSFKEEGLSFSVSFEAAFMEDMNPVILKNFNHLQAEAMHIARPNLDISTYIDNNYVPIVTPWDGTVTKSEGNSDDLHNDAFIVNGQPLKGCLVDSRNRFKAGAGKKQTVMDYGTMKYRLRWFA